MRASWITAMFLVFSIGLLSLAGGAQVAEAGNYGTFKAFGSPVNIGDGDVNPDASAEWGDAAMRTYNITFVFVVVIQTYAVTPKPEVSVPCNVYVKNNETHLLIRVEWEDPPFWGTHDPSGPDNVIIYFDDQDSQGLGDYDDCADIVETAPYVYDKHYKKVDDTPVWERDGSDDGVFDYYWDENSKKHIFEFAKTLKSQDEENKAYDFNLTFGENVTFAIEFIDGSTWAHAYLPDGFDRFNPDTWDPVIIVASPPAPRRRVAPVGGVEVPMNVPAVFIHSPLFVLALALVLAFSAIIATKRVGS